MNFEEFQQQQAEKLSGLFQTLDGESFDKESIKASINDIVNAQSEYGKNSYTKKATQTKKLLDILQQIGYDPESYENPTDFVNKFNSQKNDSTNKTEEYKLLEARLAAIEKEREDAERKSKELQKENDTKTIQQKLNDSLNGKIKGQKLVINDLINSGKVKIVEGEVVFTNGDNIVLFEDGIKSILEEYSDLIISDIKPGVGSTHNRNSKNENTLTLEELNKLSPDQIKARMSEIKKLAGVR